MRGPKPDRIDLSTTRNDRTLNTRLHFICTFCLARESRGRYADSSLALHTNTASTLESSLELLTGRNCTAMLMWAKKAACRPLDRDGRELTHSSVAPALNPAEGSHASSFSPTPAS